MESNGAAIIVLLGIGGAAYFYLRGDSRQSPFQKAGRAISWRGTNLLKEGLRGDSRAILDRAFENDSQQGGFSLRNVIAWAKAWMQPSTNPYTSREDREAGGHVFREHCARCHGPDGRGALGPSLARFGYKNGDSDLAIYRVLTDGIAGTAMLPTDLSFAERWQVVGYLRTLQVHSDNGDDEPRPLNIQVSSEQIRRTERQSW